MKIWIINDFWNVKQEMYREEEKVSFPTDKITFSIYIQGPWLLAKGCRRIVESSTGPNPVF